MPIYEYRRPDGSTFEVVQSFNDEPLTADPETGDPVQRVLHAPAVHFKGKGFYNTDYGTRKRQREASSSSDAGSGGSGGSEKAASDGASNESSATKSDTVKEPSGKSASADKPATAPAAA